LSTTAACRCYIDAMPPELLGTFEKSICMCVRSFRKDGTPVDTPTWTTPIDGKLYCYTDDRTFKVKRLRNNPNVWVAASDVWARTTSPFYPATCRFVLEPELRSSVFARLKAKYGIHWHMSLLGSLLTGRVPHRLVLEFSIPPDAKPL
jgi:PPOX class probable F420-dependent enzyme